MDTLPPSQFMDIYERLRFFVDMNDCPTYEDLLRRMEECEKLMENAGANAKKESTRWKWFKRRKFIRILLQKEDIPKTALTRQRKRDLGLPMRRQDFAKAMIDEAIKHPNGIVNLSLKHGYKKAKMKIEKQQNQKRIGLLSSHKREKNRSLRHQRK